MKYAKRVWLNKEGSPSTGSAVAFHGNITWRDEQELSTFFEVSDCHCKVRLHRIKDDSLSDFIEKLRVLAKTAEDFADFLDLELEAESEASVEPTSTLVENANEADEARIIIA